MKKLLITLTLFVLTQGILHAQSDTRRVESVEIKELKTDVNIHVNIATFIFKKFDEQKRLASFTQLDALKLERFFMNQPGVLICESNALDKTLIVTSRKNVNGQAGFNHRAVANELAPLGYAVIGLQSGEDHMLFSRKKCNDSEEVSIVRALPNSGNRPVLQVSNDDDCNDCGKVKISEQMIDKFKGMEYGGKKIDFTKPSMDATIAADE